MMFNVKQSPHSRHYVSSSNTPDRTRRPGHRSHIGFAIVIRHTMFWDGASYRRADEVRDYLVQVNQSLAGLRPSFTGLKVLFEQFFAIETFDFPKMNRYGTFSKIN